jgi:hypothetical protein
MTGLEEVLLDSEDDGNARQSTEVTGGQRLPGTSALHNTQMKRSGDDRPGSWLHLGTTTKKDVIGIGDLHGRSGNYNRVQTSGGDIWMSRYESGGMAFQP